MHLKRWLTSIIGIPVLIILISKGGIFLFALFIALVMGVSLWEYYFIVFSGRREKIATPIPAWSFLAGLLMVSFAYIGSLKLMLCLLMINLIGAAILSMPRFKDGASILLVVAKGIGGLLYIPVSLSMLVLMRNGPDGSVWVFFLLFIVFAGDVGAFYVGTYFGRRKFCPSISPNKTFEGAAGSILSSMVIGYSFKYFLLPDLNVFNAIVLILLVNMAAQAGDLFESELKRAGNVKDSGSILPGHGGFLDRIDALLFAAPVIYACKEFMIPG
ncbi:MAG: phosphatidate cytidylyltransferase [Desulfobacterales bacterium]|jgi:phosphatidate cytidylyltransferase|nr:phosphatidate cytidylyltransferase [Desulfobacterales bacterium]